jgi:hypothetical protein
MTRFVQLTKVGGRVCWVNPATVALIEEATQEGKVTPDKTRLFVLPVLNPIVVIGAPADIVRRLGNLITMDHGG